jgi:hypothetical protein
LGGKNEEGSEKRRKNIEKRNKIEKAREFARHTKCVKGKKLLQEDFGISLERGKCNFFFWGGGAAILTPAGQ